MTETIPPPPSEPRPIGRQFLLALAIFLLACLVHMNALRGGFIWDDADFLTENPLVHASDGIRRFWFTTEPRDYFPLTSTLMWAEWRLWGLTPTGYHAVNLLLHALNAVLLWRVLFRLRLPGAWLAGLLFAVHPVTVQSVAWITEGKNTLSLLFMLLSLLAYLRAAPSDFLTRWHAISVALFLFALLAKTSVVMLPLVLLLLAWWQSGAIARRDLWRTAPFFALSLAMGLVTVWFQYHRAIGGSLPDSPGPLSRTLGAAWALGFYLYKAVLPLNLCFLYPAWEVHPSSPMAWVPLVLFLVAAAILWLGRRGWSRPLILGLGTYALMVAPVLGLIPMALHYYTPVSDHLQYVPLIGIVALAAGLAAYARQRSRRSMRFAIGLAIALAIGGLATQTWQQSKAYRSNATLWADIHRKNPIAWKAHHRMARTAVGMGRLDLAVYHFKCIVEQRPDSAEAHYNLGAALDKLGRSEDALAELREAVRLAPDNPRFRAALEKHEHNGAKK